MTNPTARNASGYVFYIGAEPFFLAKDPKAVTQDNPAGAPFWEFHRVPTQEGDPAIPHRQRFNDWSRGLGDSRGVHQGAVEHCQFAFLGRVGRILPAHQVNSVTSFVAHSADITCFEDVIAPATRLLIGGGTKVSEVNPATHTLATSLVVGGSVLSMCRYIDQVAIALGEAVQFYRRDAAGAYSVSTVTSDASGTYRYANSFGIGALGQLVRGRSFYWSNCSAADFYGTNGNWSTEYDIGNKAHPITQVLSRNQKDFVMKEEGFYSFLLPTASGGGGNESNALPDFEAFASAENRSYGFWAEWIMVCSLAGLYRFIDQGAARPVGAEVHNLSESVLQNTYPTAFAGLGVWGYEARYKASTGNTYICMLRRAEQGDANFGSPVLTSSVIDVFAGYCRAMHIVTSNGVPELYYAKGATVAYIVLTPSGTPAAFQTAVPTVVNLSPTDLGSPGTVKYFRSIEVVGRNFGAGNSVTLSAIMDAGATHNVGAAISALVANYATVFWTPSSNDSGRVIQLSVSMVNASTTAPPEIRELILNYEERPLETDGWVIGVRVKDFDQEGGISSRKTAQQVRDYLLGLVGAAPFLMTDPDGTTFYAGVTVYEAFMHVSYESAQLAGLDDQDVIILIVRKLDYS